MKGRVQILMSTYNGEKYLREQLDSILMQDYSDVSLLVRDDGSSDGTVGILKEYSEENNNVKYYEGENVGVISSFFDLMNRADTDAMFFALSDQDDVWMEDKLSRAVSVLTKLSKSMSDDSVPGLYCCKELLVDEHLNPLPVYMKDCMKRPSFGNSLVENIATGATCVFNQGLLNIARKHVPEYTVMHDWWLYMAATCFGRVYYDRIPRMKYRQHDNNVMGSRNNYWDEFKIRFKRFGNNKGRLSRQAGAFERSFRGKIAEDDLELLRILLNYKKNVRIRVKGFLSRRIYRQRKEDNFIFKLLFFTNHL